MGLVIGGSSELLWPIDMKRPTRDNLNALDLARSLRSGLDHCLHNSDLTRPKNKRRKVSATAIKGRIEGRKRRHMTGSMWESYKEWLDWDLIVVGRFQVDCETDGGYRPIASQFSPPNMCIQAYPGSSSVHGCCTASFDPFSFSFPPASLLDTPQLSFAAFF